MSEVRVDRQLGDFERAAAELLAETHWWERAKRRKILANLETARAAAEAQRETDRDRKRQRKLRVIRGGQR